VVEGFIFPVIAAHTMDARMGNKKSLPYISRGEVSCLCWRRDYNS
jgi:hypothetical protein